MKTYKINDTQQGYAVAAIRDDQVVRITYLKDVVPEIAAIDTTAVGAQGKMFAHLGDPRLELVVEKLKRIGAVHFGRTLNGEFLPI